PYDDERLGLYKVAPNYYYPGWWEPGAALSFYINIKEWEKLPQAYKEALEAASSDASIRMNAEYDAKNPQALARLLANKVTLHAFPKDVMDAAYAAAFELYEEEVERNPAFKKIYEPWKRFRHNEQQWFRVAENTMAAYMPPAK